MRNVIVNRNFGIISNKNILTNFLIVKNYALFKTSTNKTNEGN